MSTTRVMPFAARGGASFDRLGRLKTGARPLAHVLGLALREEGCRAAAEGETPSLAAAPPLAEQASSSPRPAFRRLAIMDVNLGSGVRGARLSGGSVCGSRLRPFAWLRAFVAPRAISMALGRPFRAVAPHPWSGAVSHLAVLAPCARWGAPAPFPDPGVRGDACYGGRSRHWRRRKPKPSPGDLPASFGPGLGGSSPSREHLSSRPTRHPSAFGSYFAHRRF